MNPVTLSLGGIQQIIAGGNNLYVIVGHSFIPSCDLGLNWDSLSTPFKGFFYNVLAEDSCVYVVVHSLKGSICLMIKAKLGSTHS